MENKSLSPAVAAFLGLVVVMLVVGLYVTDRDIRTEGVTAEDALLPNVIPPPGEENEAGLGAITVKYANDWEPRELTGGYSFIPSETEDPENPDVEIQIFVDPRSIEQIMADRNEANIQSGPNEYDNPLFADLPAQKYTLFEEAPAGQPRILTDVIVVGLADRRSLEAHLTTNANDISEYRSLFEMMIASVEVDSLPIIEVPARDSVVAPELTELADDTGTVVSLNYPADWTVTGQANDAGFYGVNAVPNEATDMWFYILSPVDALQLLVVQTEDLTPVGLLTAYQANLVASNVVQGVTPNTVGDYEGATLVARVSGNRDAVSETGIYQYRDDLLLIYFYSTPISDFGSTIAAVDAMVQSVSYQAPEQITVETELPTHDAETPLPLTQAFYSTTFDLTFRYPETWTAEETVTQNGGTVISIASPDESTQILTLPLTEADGITPTTDGTLGLLTQNVPPDSIIQTATPYEVGELTGHTFVAVQVAAPGQLESTLVEYGAILLPDSRQLIYIVNTSPSDFGQMRATLNEILLTLGEGDTTSEISTEEGGDEAAPSSSEETNETGSTETENQESMELVG